MVWRMRYKPILKLAYQSNIIGFQCSTLSVDESKKIIFSGIQPTGVLHIGNYFGAVENWVKLQNDAKHGKMLISIVDLHALTIFKSSTQLKTNIRQMLACLLACGLDPDKVIIFQQSSVPQHALLHWILSTFASLPQLHSMPNFKEKSLKFKDGDVPLALFSYPVLQAADILLYKATHVPVGDDQAIHLNFARKLASNFNSKYNIKFFTQPSTISSNFKRIKSLRDPNVKMSKSDESAKSRIDLDDTDEVIMEKCKKALSDNISHVSYEPQKRPGISNLVNIHCAVLGIRKPDLVIEKASGMTTAQYKIKLATDLIDKFSPMRTLYEKYISDPTYLQAVLHRGNEQAMEMAQTCLKQVNDIVGLNV